MKTIDEIAEHFRNNNYSEKSLRCIYEFLIYKGIIEREPFFIRAIGDKTFEEFLLWFSSKKNTLPDADSIKYSSYKFLRIDKDDMPKEKWISLDHLTDYFEKEFQKIVKEEVERKFGTYHVNPFDCCNCTCTSSKYNVEDYFKKNDEDVTDEVVCTELESIVEYLEDMEHLPIHLQRANETLKLVIDSIEQHKK